MRILIIILLFVCLKSFGQPIFSSNFEDQNTDAEIGSEFLEYDANGSFDVVANPSSESRNNSSYVMKVSLGQGKGRAEYSTQNMETNEKKYIYTWKRYHASNMYTDINVGWMLFNQWKTWPCEAAPTALPEYEEYDDYICGMGGIFNELDWINNTTISYWSRAYPDCQEDAVTMPTGSWQTFVLEVYWTNTDNGYFRIWKNDVLFGQGDNMKTLFDEFLEGTCDIYWSNGLYAYWDKTGGSSQDYLVAYVDDIAVYDVDDGYDIDDVCPDCEVVGDTCLALNITATTTDESNSQNNGSINTTVTGGTSPYTYLWNDESVLADRSGLEEGTYSVTVTDDIGCTDTGEWTIGNIVSSVTIKPFFGGNGSQYFRNGKIFMR